MSRGATDDGVPVRELLLLPGLPLEVLAVSVLVGLTRRHPMTNDPTKALDFLSRWTGYLRPSTNLPFDSLIVPVKLWT